MLAFFRICRYNLYCALRRRIEVVITGLTRNQVASRGLEGSNPSVSASATGNAFKRCIFSSGCAGRDGELEPLLGLELHAIGQPRCYILIRFARQQSLKGESLRPACNRDNTSKRCLFSFRCAGGNGEPEPLRALELHAIGQPCCYILIRFACQQSLKGESLRPAV